MARPILFFDTNVLIDVATRSISVGDWTKALGYARRACDHRISPHTLIELLVKLQRGADEYFSKNQQPLKVLASVGGEPRFLPFPPVFLAWVLYRKRLKKPNFTPRDMRNWLYVSVRATTRDDLATGVALPGTVATYGVMDLKKVDDELQEAKDRHSLRLQRMRTGEAKMPTREQWGFVLKGVPGEPHDNADALRITDALDAAYTLDLYLARMAREGSYDFREHDSDYLDMNQLCYLSDDRVHMVTRERKLLARIAGSTQSDRVLAFSDLLARADGRDGT